MSMGWEVAGLAAIAAILIALAIWTIFSYRISPEKRERMRRLTLNNRGRLGDGVLTEANDSTVYYTYSVNGVSYAASQDITTLYEFLPADPERLVGPIWIKYAAQNPANSIVVCERWSGLGQSQLKEKAK